MKAILANQKKEVTKASLGLDQVDNTSDLDKPISDATQAALDALSETVDTKQASIIGAASTITSSNLTSNMVLVSNSSGKVAASGSVSTTELGYLDGVTSNVQTQLNNKASTSSLSSYLAKSGGTMTGSLILSGDPTSDLEAATKQYVDNLAQSASDVWGGETAYGDATWWANLKSWAASTTAANRASCVGKTKKVLLTYSVAGTTSHLVRCIGADQDGIGTLTFQTQNCMSSTIKFSSSSAAWIGSTARSLCQNYYSYFPGKSSIKTVSKGTCVSYSDSRAASVTYNNETVWLPSEREMGLNTYSPISTANSTTSKAECTKGYNASYSYYNSDAARIKYYGDSSTTAAVYWERSFVYNNTSDACFVDSSGSAKSAAYSAGAGLAPAFVIG